MRLAAMPTSRRTSPAFGNDSNFTIWPCAFARFWNRIILAPLTAFLKKAQEATGLKSVFATKIVGADNLKETTMSDDVTSIHEFDLTLICDYFSHLERQGPGSPEVTMKALSFIENLNDKSRIADIGCGSGGQTMALAQNAPGSIVGIDLFPIFIDLFNRNAAKLHLQDRVKGVVASMENLPFQEEELDLIWSEGAIYNIGFQRGLHEWRKFLKLGAYLAVSEASWFTEERPAEINDFWKAEYPEIDTIPNKVAQMQKAGYVPVATFILPDHCWTEHFYEPQVEAQRVFLEKNAGNKAAEHLIKNQQHEAQLHCKYKDYYGYVFYIGKKIY
jgi:SAM-dependent methyltransferase